MKLSFRQGIVSAGFKPIPYLSVSGTSVNLSASPSVVLNFAHGDADYLVYEKKNVTGAWKISKTNTSWLYWDLNLDSGALSRDLTTLEPLYGTTEPDSPNLGQHFFNINTNKMLVWSGVKWYEVARLFAAKSTNGVLTLNHAGSQVGQQIPVDAGKIVFDRYGKVIKRFNDDGSFELITETTTPYKQYSRLYNTKFEYATLYGVASETIPAFRCVTWKGNRELGLASNANADFFAIGFVTKASTVGQNREFITKGFVVNKAWSWTAPVNSPIFLGVDGVITVNPPDEIAVQKIGYIVSPTTVYLDIRDQIVIDPSYTPTPTPSITPYFTPSPTPSVTPTITPTISITPTITPTVTVTPSITSSVTPSPTITPTMSVTPSPTVITYFYDSFTDADATPMTSHTPDIDVVGNGWVAFDSNFLTIDSNNALANFGTIGGVYADVGQVDGIIKINFLNSTALSGGRLAFRFTDTDNHWQINIDSGGTQLTLYKHAAGVVTAEDAAVGLSITVPCTVEVTLNGDSISATVVGFPSATVSVIDAFNQNQSNNMVLWNAPDGIRYDEMYFQSL